MIISFPTCRNFESHLLDLLPEDTPSTSLSPREESYSWTSRPRYGKTIRREQNRVSHFRFHGRNRDHPCSSLHPIMSFLPFHFLYLRGDEQTLAQPTTRNFSAQDTGFTDDWTLPRDIIFERDAAIFQVSGDSHLEPTNVLLLVHKVSEFDWHYLFLELSVCPIL